MKKIGLLTLIAVIALTQTAAFARNGRRNTQNQNFAQQGPQNRRGIRQRRPQRGQMMLRLITRHQEELGVTDEQLQQLKELNEDNDDIQAAREEVRELREQLQQLVRQGADEQQLRAAAALIGSAIGDVAVLQAEKHAAVEQILTQEQLDQIKELTEEIKNRMRQRRQNRQNQDDDQPARRQRRTPRRQYDQ
jgi:Spy/CpxP family protein refolding chaperone